MSKLQQRYVELGWNPIPVPARSKNPNRRGWEAERTKPEDIPSLWNNGQNTGLITGESSSWLVDGDLDCREARAIAGRFWDPTLTSGRESSPDSHWWFYSEGFGYHPFTDLDNKKKLLEVSGDGGHQTIVEPSTHPCGEKILWSRSGLEPLVVEASDLLERSRKLATAALIARHLPERRDDHKDTGGGRHDLGNALAGFLLRRGLSEDDVLLILIAAWDAYGFEGDTAGQREAHRDLQGIVRDTARKIRDGEPATGGRTLEGMVPKMPRKLADYFGWTGSIDDREGSKKPEIPRPELAEDALTGLFGDITKAIMPHSEADPAAILFSTIAAFGSAIGRDAYMPIAGVHHHGNLFIGIAGKSAQSRKGTSWGPVEDLFSRAAPEWAHGCVSTGLSSGEGLIERVRDDIKTPNKDGDLEVTSPGVKDKRLLVQDGELSGTLKVISRDNNTLSDRVREAWDGKNLEVMTRNSPLKATKPHISILGHITMADLAKHLTESEVANGLANRFLWIYVERGKPLPFGGDWEDVNKNHLVSRLQAAIEYASSCGRMYWGEDSKEAWEMVYAELWKEWPGMYGAIVARGAAQTLRLSMLCALADHSNEIESAHILQAFALWSYAQDSAEYLFGRLVGDKDADKALRMLQREGALTRNQISEDVFAKNKNAADLDLVRDTLLEHGAITVRKEETGGKGRPTEVWEATE